MAQQRGVHDFSDLKDRSRIDEETGCWIVSGHRHKGTTSLWCVAAGATLSLTATVGWLMTGAAPAPGVLWVAVCGNTGCGNPAHRKLGDRGLLMRVMRPKLDPLHRARIQAAHLKRSAAYSPEVRAQILESDESGKALARRLGVHESVVSKVRRGESWRAMAPTASVFSLGALA